jgi:putative oxidoreductase
MEGDTSRLGAIDAGADASLLLEVVMDVVVLIGRILFAALFAVSAMGHFGQTDAMTGYAKSKGVPAARLAVLGGGVLLALGTVSVLLGIWSDLGALLLVVFLVPTALLMHGFWRESDAQAKQTEQVQFFKDTALAGASLMLFALFAHLGDELGLVIIGPLFDL